MSKKQRELSLRKKAGNAKLWTEKKFKKFPVFSQYLSNVMVKQAIEFTKASK